MSNCKEIRDFILTDYIDGEIHGALKKTINDHLSECGDCLMFAREVEKNLIDPFKTSPKKEVPEALWRSIKEKIENSNAKGRRIKDFWGRLTGSFSFPKLAAPVFMLLLAMGTIFFHIQRENQAREQEQVEYLAYVLTPPDLQETDNNSSPMPIEEYFL